MMTEITVLKINGTISMQIHPMVIETMTGMIKTGGILTKEIIILQEKEISRSKK